MNRALVEIIAEYALFLEHAEESDVPLETAVRQQEDLAFRLQKLSFNDRRVFIEMLSEIAMELPSTSDRELLLRLPDDVGIR